MSAMLVRLSSCMGSTRIPFLAAANDSGRVWKRNVDCHVTAERFGGARLFRGGVKMDPEVAAYVEVVRECNSGYHQTDELLKFSVGAAHVGYVTPEFGGQLAEFPDVFKFDPSMLSFEVNPVLSTPQERTKAVGGVMQTLRERGLMNGWRNELYPITQNFHDDPLLLVERVAAVKLGVKAYGVHINGYTYKDGQLHMWVARRSKNKPTWPSLLDHIAAGGQPFGLGCRENVIKECEEEASIPKELAEKAISSGVVTYSQRQEDGIKRDVLFVYDLELPSDFIPTPLDGEVEEFMLWPISKVADIIRNTREYKPNCALVIIDFFIRRGVITPDQSGYLQLVEGLRAGDCS
ncbi:hypothetical protein BSKO_09015 [Bryopsis sp. KO-2023]|nr:hypothetical protein BSKO_09015 [Bryopsis sp. KO-2023]